MLIKTEVFDRVLNSELYQITINKNQPLIKRGSYKIKPIGSVITDIDLAQFVYANPGLIARLNQILDSLPRKGTFIFTRLHCGMYSDFTPPWSVDGKGSCVYDPKQAQEWYRQLRGKNVMDEKSYKSIENKLFSSDMTIKDLLEIKQIIRPFSEILWDREDIRKGYKVFLGQKYNLIDLMQKGHVTVLRYLYKYGHEYVSIDFGLVDKKYIKEPSILHEYYRGNIYKIFKSYKWYLQKEYFDQYLNVMKDLENFTGLLNRVKLISTVVRYKILPEREINYLIDDAAKQAKILGMKYSLEITSQTEKALNARIQEIVQSNRKYFRERIQDRFKKEVMSYELRSAEAIIPVSQKLIATRVKQGMSCPFFQVDLSDFQYLVKLSERTLINPVNMLNCVSMAAKTFDIDVSLLIKTVFDQNEFYLKEVGDEILLEEKGKVIEKVPKNKIKKLQLKILKLKNYEKK
jgi:hypothetical protein